MKKLLCLLLSALMLGGAFVSCSKSNKEDSSFLSFQYNYDLSEYIDLADYKNLPANGYHVEVTDEDIERQILTSRAYYARLTDVTGRGAEEGDTIYIDYVGTIDGEEFEGGSEEDCEVVLGAGAFFEDFENALIGAYPETSLSVDLTVPTPYLRSPELAGQNAHFEITVHDVCETEMPEYTDDFVRVYLGYGSRAEYEAATREKLQEYYEKIYYEYIYPQVWQQVLDNTVVKKWPEAEFNAMYDTLSQAERLYAESLGMTFPQYLGYYYDITEEEYDRQVREEVESRIKEEMIAYAIGRAEHFTLSEEEYTKRATRYATEYYELASLEAFEALYDKNFIRQTLLVDMAIEFVVDNADVTYLN